MHPRDPRRDSRGERSPWLPLETRPDSPGAGMGEFNSDDHYIYYCGQESLRRSGAAPPWICSMKGLGAPLGLNKSTSPSPKGSSAFPHQTRHRLGLCPVGPWAMFPCSAGGVRYLGWEDPLEEGMATHSSILAWRIAPRGCSGLGEPRQALPSF